MTDKEALKIKTFLEGAFPILKETKESDFVYAVMLKDYKFDIMFEAAKNYVRKSVYTPTIAALIQEYEAIVKKWQGQMRTKLLAIVEQMNDAGAFQPKENHWVSGEYAAAILEIEDGQVGEWLKEKILEFTGHNSGVAHILEYFSGKEKKDVQQIPQPQNNG